MTRAYPSEARQQAKSIPGRKIFLLAGIAALLVLPISNLGAQKAEHGGKAKTQATAHEVRIPVVALGYTAPGVMPAFQHHALVGLHYIDANHLLFTFNVKGLLRRDDRCSGAGTQRMVRAVVLDLPSGRVEKQADWQLYDHSDFLWSLGNGQFLLRICSRLEVVGASLEPHPLIQPSGSVESIGFSPDRSVVVIEQTSQQTPTPPKSKFAPEAGPTGKVDVEFVRLHPLEVIARSRIPVPSEVPIVATGILETLAAAHNGWVIDLQLFHGAERKILTLHSACQPKLTPITDTVVVAGTCSETGERSFQAFDLNGSVLWQFQLSDDRHGPRFLLTQNGAHFAIESLHTKQPLGPFDPLSRDLIDGEVIDIYDTLTGVRIGGFLTKPVYTAGTNAAFSPDGTRLALLHEGAIEIYALSELGKTGKAGPTK